MVHTAPPPRNRRRIELAIGAVLAVAGLVIAAVAVVALSHPKGREAAKATNLSSSAPSTPAKPSATPSKTKTTTPAPSKSATSTHSNGRPALLVLNNTDRSGLAATAVGRFKQGGWTASNGGNFSGDILSTAAYYDPSVSGAHAAAEALQAQFPAIQRVKERFDGLPSGPIVVVLASDYS